MKRILMFTIAALALTFHGFAEDHQQPDIAVPLEDCASDPDHLVGDRAFMRRVWLDLTGVLPEAQTVEQFAASSNPEKRADMIDLALRSTAFVDRWTNYLEELFKSRFIIPTDPMFRNRFHEHLRQMVADGTPWDEMARDLITYSGLGIDPNSSMTFWIAGFIDTDFRLDYLDDQTTFITETMLGLKTDCISCHDGAFHLEPVNKGLSVMKRQQFWELSAFLASSYLYVPAEALDDRGNDEAFFSQLHFVEIDDPNFQNNGYLVAAEPFNQGEYVAESEAGDGMRKPRDGGVVSPRYFRTGETPQPGETRRQALARMLTQDRQFARNMVNRIWAHMIGEGFVDPLNDWDLGRLDAQSAAAFETTVQARTPALMEELTDGFIASGFDLRELMRTIANTPIYQWDYFSGETSCSDGNAYWRQSWRARRLEAEAILESYLRFLEIDLKYVVTGYPDRTFYSTWQMPGTLEPNPFALVGERDGDYYLLTDPRSLGYASFDDYYQTQNTVLQLLSQLGRDDRLQELPRRDESNIQIALLMMNNPTFSIYLENAGVSPFLAGLVRDLTGADSAAQEAAVRTLFLQALTREPTSSEMQFALDYVQQHDPQTAVTDLAWALINHPDFLYK